MLILNNKAVEFIPEKEKGKENPATFMVKPPTRDTILQINQLTQDVVIEMLQNGEDVENVNINLLALKNFSQIKTILIDTCVVGWKNVFEINEKNEQVEAKFDKQKLKDIADMELIEELANFIDDLSKPTEKNE